MELGGRAENSEDRNDSAVVGVLDVGLHSVGLQGLDQGLDLGAVQMCIRDRTYTCTSKTIIGGQEIICMGEHGTLSMTQALAHSCNVYYGELAAALGKMCIRDSLHTSQQC